MKIAVWLAHPVAALSLTDSARTRLQSSLTGVEWIECADEKAFRDALRDARAALTWRCEEEWVRDAAALEWIATPSAGRDWLRVRERPGLAVTFGTFHGELMAETAVGMALAFARGLHESWRRMASGWPRDEVGRTMRPLRGSRATIVGFGAVGRWIGRLLSPFGVRLTGVGRTLREKPDYFGTHDRMIAMEDLDAVLPETDHLFLALPGEAGMAMDARRLALLPASAHLYNVGRGIAVDEEALAGMLAEGRLAGAGLDVFREEPLPDGSPLRRLPNVILMPHASAFSPNYMDLFADEFIAMWRARYGGDAPARLR